MSVLKHVVLFRHGETDYNAENRFQGHLDVPLNDTGRRQAQGLVPLLAPRGLEAVLASDLARAHETGRIVANALGLPLFLDPRLREAHLGEAQGLTRAELEARFGADMLARWRSPLVTDADVAFPGGEAASALLRRALEGLDDFLATQPYTRIGVATHGGVIRRLMRAVLPPDAPPVPIPNGVVYEVVWESSSRRICVADEVQASAVNPW